MKTTILQPYGVRLVLIEETKDVATAKRRWIDPDWILDTLDDDESVGGYVATASGGAGARAPVILTRIQLGEGYTQEHLFNTVVHESAHIANAVFHMIHQEVEYGTDEPHAYLLAHIAEWVWGHVGPPLTPPVTKKRGKK